MQTFVISTFKREMHRPSAAKLWQMPQAAVLPMPPAEGTLATPLEVQAASYLAASDKIVSFSIKSIFHTSLCLQCLFTRERGLFFLEACSRLGTAAKIQKPCAIAERKTEHLFISLVYHSKRHL